MALYPFHIFFSTLKRWSVYYIGGRYYAAYSIAGCRRGGTGRRGAFPTMALRGSQRPSDGFFPHGHIVPLTGGQSAINRQIAYTRNFYPFFYCPFYCPDTLIFPYFSGFFYGPFFRLFRAVKLFSFIGCIDSRIYHFLQIYSWNLVYWRISMNNAV